MAIVVPSLYYTNTVTGVACTAVYSGGNVTSDGCGTITARGVCYATTPNPTIANSKTVDAGTTGSWTSGTFTIVPGILYYVRSYATNSAGTSYGYPATYIQTIIAPSLSPTTAASSITTNSAVSGGSVSSSGGNLSNCGAVTERGICWSTTSNPTTASSKATCGTGTGTYTGNLTGLLPNTTYYVRSYAINSAGTGYGSQISFTTAAITATLTQYNVYGGSNFTAIQYTVTLGAAAIGTKYFSVTHTNTTNSGNATENITVYNGATSGTLSISYIKQVSLYNALCDFNGTQAGYTNTSSQLSYPIAAIKIPTLSTTAATAITTTTASSGGNVSSDEGATVTERGICWSTSQNPTTANSKASSGTGTGSFSVGMTGLSTSTTYWVRAYAINAVGTAYGAQVTFTTLANPIIANISSRSVAGGSTYIAVEWKVTLASSATSAVSIPYSCTNSSNTYYQTGNWPSIATGSTTSTFVVTYNRPIGANYTATCIFGTMPSGYSAGSTASYTVLKQ